MSEFIDAPTGSRNVSGSTESNRRSEPHAVVADDGWDVEVFYDGDCPLCVREIRMLRRFDRKNKIRFTDIAAPEFHPADFGMSMHEFMDEIQGRLSDGTWIVGVEVFRRLYAAIGLTPVVWLTRIPGITHALDFGYRVFAKNRLKLTGRCASGQCEIPH